jgi:stage II sporulation protein AB (anti-sigma F factor)
LAKENQSIKMEFSARDSLVAAARLATAAFCAELGFTFTDIEEIKVAVSEGVSNAIIHGYGGKESGIVELTMSVVDGILELTVKDDGTGIEDVEKAMEPAYSSVDGRMGLGFVFMSSFMDSLDVISAPGEGTLVRMIKRCPRL